MPFAAVATSSSPSSSSSRNAAVSVSRISVIRSSSSLEQLVEREVGERDVRDPLERLAAARSVGRSRSYMRAWEIAIAARSAASCSSSRVLGGEHARHERADVQHADDLALDQQRHAEQRADPALAQDRVEDVGVVDVLDQDRPPLGRDPAREPAPDRDPDALLDLLLDPLRRPRHAARSRPRRAAGTRPCPSAGSPSSAAAARQEVVERQVRERDVRHALQRLERVRRPRAIHGMAMI